MHSNSPVHCSGNYCRALADVDVNKPNRLEDLHGRRTLRVRAYKPEMLLRCQLHISTPAHANKGTLIQVTGKLPTCMRCFARLSAAECMLLVIPHDQSTLYQNIAKLCIHHHWFVRPTSKVY